MNWQQMSFARPMIIAMIMGLAACSTTPPSEYYMLSVNANGVPGDTGPSIGVGPIQIPEYLNRREIVLNHNDHRLEVQEYQRWAEPLDEGLSRVLSLNLATLLDTQQVQRFPWRRNNLPEFAISVRVIQLSVQDNEAILVAEWTISSPADKAMLHSRISQISAPMASANSEQVAAAYSSLLLKLSKEIAASIQ